MAIDRDFYNQASAEQLGWSPSWFGCRYFDDDLAKAIRKFQREHDVTADGLCGPMTYRRVWTDRESRISEFKPETFNFSGTKHLVHNGNFIPIEWDKVVLWNEVSGLTTKAGAYYNFAGKEDREPTFFVNHWDVCLSAESCANVLRRRGISVHFCIDNDGTIFQLLDTQHGAWQAGSRTANLKSVGVEISNAYYTKYQGWYEDHGYGPRPVASGVKCHGRSLKDHLGFYPVQLEALKALWKAMHIGLGIPLECPTDANGDLVETVDEQCKAGNFEGFINHYNLTNRKIDCAGLDMLSLMDDVTNSPVYCVDG